MNKQIYIFKNPKMYIYIIIFVPPLASKAKKDFRIHDVLDDRDVLSSSVGYME